MWVNINQAMPNGITALHLAVQNDNVEALELLLKSGVDVNQATSGDGFSPLHLAVQYDNLKAIKALLEEGADINQVSTNDYYNFSPIHLAAWKGHIEAFKLLLKKGIEITPRTSAAEKPATIARDQEAICLDILESYNRLKNYIKQTEKRNDTSYSQDKLNYWGIRSIYRLFGARSAGEKAAAARQLKLVFEDKADQSSLAEHQSTLKKGRLSEIYQDFKRYDMVR